MEPSLEKRSFAQHFNSPQEQERIAGLANDESRRLFIAVLGQTGSGKSTTITNLLRGCDPIPDATPYGMVGSQSVTNESKMHNGHLYDCPATFIDQAGFGDTRGLTDASILGNTLVFCATQVPRQRIDGFIIVSSAEESRCYIDSYSRVIEALFGREALKRTLVLITKSEGLFGKKYQQNQAKMKIESQEAEAKRIGGLEILPFFNSIVDEDYRELIAENAGLQKDEHGFYLPLMRRIIQYFFQERADPTDNRVLRIREVYDEIVYKMRQTKGTFVEMKQFQANPANQFQLKAGRFVEGVERACGTVNEILDNQVVRLIPNIIREVTYFCAWGLQERPPPQVSQWGTVKTSIQYECQKPGPCFDVEVNCIGDYDNLMVQKSSDNRSVMVSLDTIGYNTPMVTVAFTVKRSDKDREIFEFVKEAIAKHSFSSSGNGDGRYYPTSIDSLKALVFQETQENGL